MSVQLCFCGYKAAQVLSHTHTHTETPFDRDDCQSKRVLISDPRKTDEKTQDGKVEERGGKKGV